MDVKVQRRTGKTQGTKEKEKKIRKRERHVIHCLWEECYEIQAEGPGKCSNYIYGIENFCT